MFVEMGKILMKSTLVVLIQAIPTKKQNNTRMRSEMTLVLLKRKVHHIPMRE